MSTASAAVAALLGAILFVALRHKRGTNDLPFPPGPPRLPVLGNALADLTTHPWKRYSAWSKEHGSDVIYLNMAGTAIVVLNTYEACVELFDKRSGSYSSRPPMPMLIGLMKWGWNLGLMPYGERWRAHRRIAHQSLNEEATKSFRPHQMQMVQTMLKGFWNIPGDIYGNVLLMISQVILSTIYGLEAESSEDPHIRLAEELSYVFRGATVPGKYLVDILPFLKYVPRWFPGANFQHDARKGHEVSERYLNGMLSAAEAKINSGTAGHSFVAHHLERIEKDKGSSNYEDDRQVIRNVAGVIYGAGVETTLASLMTFIHMMVLNPEVQHRAQAELDRVLPKGQLPSFDELDAQAFPYITAIVLETLRWNPPTPLLVPHYSDMEGEYKGYRIPKDAIVFGNAWAILRDEKMYPEPEKFNPERFLKEDGSINEAILDPRSVIFGFGRRICPGLHFAYATLWLSVASLLKVFDISCDLDASGKPIEPEVEYKVGLVVWPAPFKCRIQPRSTERESFEHLLQPLQ